MSSIDQQFVEYVVKSLVGKPDAVKIERRIDEKGVLLELTVDPEDLGRVIGKRGATAQSLRTLLRALGTKNDARYNLKIVDNGEPYERRSRDNDQPVKNEEPQVDESPVADDSTSAADDAPADSTGDKVTDDAPIDNDGSDEAEDHSNVVSRTRKELEEFDDLDV